MRSVVPLQMPAAALEPWQLQILANGTLDLSLANDTIDGRFLTSWPQVASFLELVAAT